MQTKENSENIEGKKKKKTLKNERTTAYTLICRMQKKDKSHGREKSDGSFGYEDATTRINGPSFPFFRKDARLAMSDIFF